MVGLEEETRELYRTRKLQGYTVIEGIKYWPKSTAESLIVRKINLNMRIYLKNN